MLDNYLYKRAENALLEPRNLKFERENEKREEELKRFP